jgi:hypothetical protein
LVEMQRRSHFLLGPDVFKVSQNERKLSIQNASRAHIKLVHRLDDAC